MVDRVKRVSHRTGDGVRLQASQGVIRGGVGHTGFVGKRKEGAAGVVRDDTGGKEHS